MEIASMKKLMIMALLLVCPWAIFAQTVDDLVLITEDYPPLNFQRDGKAEGISVDTLTEMLTLTGSRKKREDIKFWPWARGYETALKEKGAVLFAMTRTDARE